MKKLRIIFLLSLVVLMGFTSCSKSKKREKITDPVQQEALRTRNQDIPVDSLFTATALREIASPFKKISIKKLFTEVKASWKVSAENATREKYAKEKLVRKDKMKEDAAKKAAAKASAEDMAEFKASFTERVSVTFRDLPAEGYSPSLTIYFLVVLVAFAIIFTIRVIKAFFISPK